MKPETRTKIILKAIDVELKALLTADLARFRAVKQVEKFGLGPTKEAA